MNGPDDSTLQGAAGAVTPRPAWRIAAFVAAAAIGVVSLLPPRGTPGVEIADLGETLAMVLHGIGYAVRAFAVMLAQRNPRLVPTAVGLILYGAFLEMTQWVIGLRSAQLGDVLANSGGVLVGVAVALVVPRPRPA